MRSFGIFIQFDHRLGGPGFGVAAESGLFHFHARQNPWLPAGSSRHQIRREQGHRGKRFDCKASQFSCTHRSGRSCCTHETSVAASSSGVGLRENCRRDLEPRPRSESRVRGGLRTARNSVPADLLRSLPRQRALVVGDTTASWSKTHPSARTKEQMPSQRDGKRQKTSPERSGEVSRSPEIPRFLQETEFHARINGSVVVEMEQGKL